MINKSKGNYYLFNVIFHKLKNLLNSIYIHLPADISVYLPMTLLEDADLYNAPDNAPDIKELRESSFFLIAFAAL